MFNHFPYIGRNGVRVGINTSIPTSEPSQNLWTPEDDVSGQLMWMDASDTSTITVDGNNYVTSWNDKSSNTHTFTPVSAATGDTPPLSNFEQLNGLNTLTYEGGNSRGLSMSGDISATASDYIVIYVVDPDTVGSDVYLTDNSDIRLVTTYYTTQGNNGIGFHPNSSGSWVVSGQSTSAPQINTFNLGNNSQSEAFLNGTSVVQGSWIQRAIITDFFIGSRTDGTSKVIDGKLGEFIIYNRTETALQQKLEGYLAHKWGLANNLPNDHPYKNSAPTVSDSGGGFPYTFPIILS